MDLVNDSTLTHITEKVGERKTNKETDRLKDRQIKQTEIGRQRKRQREKWTKEKDKKKQIQRGKDIN